MARPIVVCERDKPFFAAFAAVTAAVAAATAMAAAEVPFPVALPDACPTRLHTNPPASFRFPCTHFEIWPELIPIALSASAMESNFAMIVPVSRSICSTAVVDI